MTRFDYEHPAQIDGDLPEVREAVVRQLKEMNTHVARLIDGSYRQLRNCGVTDAMVEHEEATGDELIELWLESDEGRLTARARQQAAALIRTVRELCELPQTEG